MDIFLLTLFLVTCLLLIMVVLLQKGRGGGLAAAFGGAGSSAFGTRTGDVFTWVTIVLTALFLLLAVGASLVVRPPQQTVAAPVLDPSGGGFSEPFKVAIECPTGGAGIYYTTDGGEPTTASAKYQPGVRIDVEPPATIKAKAFHKDMKASETVTAVYTLAKPEQPEAETPPGAETQPAEKPAPEPAP